MGYNLAMCYCNLIIQQLKNTGLWANASFTGCGEPDCEYLAQSYDTIPGFFDFKDYFEDRKNMV